jgi:hypothetical protein
VEMYAASSQSVVPSSQWVERETISTFRTAPGVATGSSSSILPSAATASVTHPTDTGNTGGSSEEDEDAEGEQDVDVEVDDAVDQDSQFFRSALGASQRTSTTENDVTSHLLGGRLFSLMVGDS